MPTGRPRRGDELELLIDGIDGRGRGLARWSGERVRVDGAVPGQRIRARVRGRRRGTVEAARLAVMEPGPFAAAPRCAHVESCGGCGFQELGYGAQLVEKERLLGRVLAPLGVHGAVPIEAVVGCPSPWGYRNKMDFTFSNRRWIEPGEDEGAEAGFALGLHAAGRHGKVIDVLRCEIAFEEASGILATVRRLARERGLEPWNVRTHAGLLRHLVLRKGIATGEIMIDLVTSTEDPQRSDPFADAVLDRHPEVSTFVQSVNTRPAAIAVGERERILHGTGWIEEGLANLRFVISAGSFFQTNTPQAERLVEIVRDRAEVASGDVLYDLCSGAGVLGLALAREAREVWGFELVPAAVDDARRNARRNGIENARFVQGDLARTLAPDAIAAAQRPAPDACIVDPPRAGLHPKVVAALRRLTPPRLVYVSCNAEAAVRDLLPLLSDGYRLRHVEPLDMFPHTPHLESVFTLARG